MAFFTELYKDIAKLPEDLTRVIIKTYLSNKDFGNFLFKIKKEVKSLKNEQERYIDFDLYKNKKNKKLSKKEYLNNKVRIKNKNSNYIDIGIYNKIDKEFDNLFDCQCDKCCIFVNL